MVVSSIADVFRELNWYEVHKLFLDSSYYEFLFPFLLAYAVFYTALCQIKLFQHGKNSKNPGAPIKPVIVILAFVVSFYGVSFKLRDGSSIGELLMMMFPNISALTIGLLGAYVVGTMLGKNVFKGLFRKDQSAYLYIGVGIIGLGSVIYYVGVAMGFWFVDSVGPESQWNTIFAIAFLILGVVFLFIDMIGYAIILFLVFGAYVYNSGDGTILEYFVDPVIFIILIIVVLISWLNSDKEEKDLLDEKIKQGRKSIDTWKKNGVNKDFEAPIRDIIMHNLESNEKKWKKKYR